MLIDTSHEFDSGHITPYQEIIATYAILSDSEERALLRVASDRDANSLNREDARELLVLHNLRYIVSIALKYIGCGVEIEDLIQEGIVGLLMAIDRFEVSNGNRLSVYACWWIKKCIVGAINEHPAGIHVQSTIPIHRILKERERIFVQTGEYPTFDTLADAIGCTPPAGRVSIVIIGC